MDPLTTLQGRLHNATLELAYLTDTAEAIRTTRPPGYTYLKSNDGVRRPVEDVIVALDDRGVSSALFNAGHALEAAIYAAERAVGFLDDAIVRWEGNDGN